MILKTNISHAYKQFSVVTALCRSGALAAKNAATFTIAIAARRRSYINSNIRIYRLGI